MSHYARHFACFHCRRSFKRPREDAVLACSHCKQPAVNLGRNFKPPRATDRAQWEKVRRLVDAGFPYGAPNEPWPDSLGEVDGFVERNLASVAGLHRAFADRYEAIMAAARAAADA